MNWMKYCGVPGVLALFTACAVSTTTQFALVPVNVFSGITGQVTPATVTAIDALQIVDVAIRRDRRFGGAQRRLGSR